MERGADEDGSFLLMLLILLSLYSEAEMGDEEQEHEQDDGVTVTPRSMPESGRGLRLHLACCSLGAIIHRFAADGSARIHPVERGQTA